MRVDVFKMINNEVKRSLGNIFEKEVDKTPTIIDVHIMKDLETLGTDKIKFLYFLDKGRLTNKTKSEGFLTKFRQKFNIYSNKQKQQKIIL